MKKIGIITFQGAINYGAILQTYALEKAIEDLGGQAEVINYRCERIYRQYKPYDYKGCNTLVDVLKKIIKNRQLKEKHKKFDAFKAENIKLTDTEYVTKESLYDLNNKFDCFITGSDQVFGIDCTDFDTSYFLDFVKDNSKKFSYAASLGLSEIPEDYIERYKKLLGEFNKLSVREYDSKIMLEKLLNRKVYQNIDPTLLYDSKFWLSVAVMPEISEKYVLIYELGVTKHLINAAVKIAKDKNLKIVFLNSNIKREFECKNMIHVKAASPQEFVGFFYKAECVVTNSFHGTAFSIIFNKKFYIEANDKKKSNRMNSLFKIIGIEHRFLPEIDRTSIDWGSVNEKLNEERKASLEYLGSIINE